MTNGFDKLLRESLAAEADGNGADCPDAAIVAGWFDGTLSHADRTAMEAHAATCARCQATIAALVRTDRPAPRAWWRAPAVQWLVPVAVAAGASLIIWTGVLRTDDDGAPPATSARLESASVPAGTPGSAGTEPGAAPGGRAGAADAAAQTAPVADADTRASANQRAQRARVAAPKTASAEVAKASPPVETPQASITAPLQQAPESVRRADASSPAPAAMAGAAAAPAPVAPRADLPSATMDTAGQSTERAFVQSVAGAAGRGGGRAPLIQSPDRSVRWRITGQKVERSADGGLSWQTQTTSVNAMLVAGVAPSSTVCWLVGWRGVVLKTTDGGQTWTRVAFPEEINLVGVVADDDQTASVTAAGGRQLHTTDGGGSWK